MPTYRLTLEYCGKEFYGWAAQPDQRTVEAVVSRALDTILSETCKLTVAGRTDTGVHAWAQVASFAAQGEVEPSQLAYSLNGVLPRDVAVLGAERVEDGFDARRDARSRRYCYRMLTRRPASPFERERALWYPLPLDRPALDVCAAALIGKHDFTAFTPTQTDHVRFERRVLSAVWSELERSEGDLLEFWIEADSFMRHMVRALVGTMLEVASGKRTFGDFERLLSGAPRPEAGPTADPHGLYLASVRY